MGAHGTGLACGGPVAGAWGLFGGCGGRGCGLPYGDCGDPQPYLTGVWLELDGPFTLDMLFTLDVPFTLLVDHELDAVYLRLADFLFNWPERCAWAASLFGARKARWMER